jgi:hypothetical protein
MGPQGTETVAALLSIYRTVRLQGHDPIITNPEALRSYRGPETFAAALN